MTTLTVGKPSSNKNDVKNASLAMKSRQQVINEVNKRRTLLQDNSWIKKRPEEENTDENYGRAVLNQYKSQDSLHRNADEQDDQKALLSRYRSDTTLDRISGRSDADKANKLPTLESRSSKSKEPDVSFSTGNSTSPVKKKRQSWMPPPVSNQKIITADMEQKRHSWGQPNTAAGIPVNNKLVPTASDKMGGPKMTIYSSEPNASPKSNGAVNDRSTTRQISPLKPNVSDVNRTATTERIGRNQDLDNLIKVKAKEDKSDQRRSQDQEKSIQDKPNINKHDQRHQDPDDVIQVNRAPNGYGKGAPEQGYNTSNIPAKQSDADHLYQVTRGSSYNASSSHSRPKDTIVYTRTYENSQFPHDAYEDTIPGKSIKTVYSTSDRAIIEKEMCTYCRKPLAMDTKMILDALQICCHASCFKCEVCQAPLENLKAGDSIWIYRNTVHCTPCYSKVKASWAY